MLRFTVICVLVIPALAQTKPDFQEAVRAAMSSSIEKQRASIRKQAAPAPEGSFFTVPMAPPAISNALEPVCDPIPAEQLGGFINDAAAKEGVKADLVRAVIGKESANRPCAVSPKGAQGLMQLMPETAEQFGVRDPFDPKQNIDAGTKLLKLLLSKYGGDVALALSAYNAGEKRVEQEGGIPKIPETVNYVSTIMGKLPADIGKPPEAVKPISDNLGRPLPP